MSFVHLHVHSEYSLLDGMTKIADAPEYVKALGMNALAITDHGAMFGVVDFYKSCRKAGIKPIIGCEVYTAARTRFDTDPVKDRGAGHLILLAENETGYRNLTKLVSKSYVEGFYYRPRVDKALLREYSDGLICLSACLAGNVQRCLINGDYDGARAEALELKDIYGADNFFLEIQNHGLPEDLPVMEGLKRLSEEIGTPLVATNDAHYIRREDAKTHDVLLAIQTQKTLDDPNRMRFENDQFYLKDEAEMKALFPGLEDACERTQEIADRCQFDFVFGEYHLPEFVPPEGLSNREYLRELCEKGLKERYGEEAWEEDSLYRKRLESELAVIESMGYVEYFLIVWDFIHYAKSQGIPVGPGRGSAAGSIVSYSLGITSIDPIKYQLIFERFLNPERVSMPDIDVDFCVDRRQEVIDYVVRKYGKEKVSQIITFGRLKAKAAIRDVARAYGVSYSETDALAKMIPNTLAITIKDALEINRDLRSRYENEPMVRTVLDMSMALENMPRNTSTHAAGVVISRTAIDDYVPLYATDGMPATQFTMTTIEELGLLKMDFLGLRNLTMIHEALRLIEKEHGVRIDFDKMDYDDPEVYRLIASGNTEGIFQLESGGMTSFMKNLKPNCFEDIVAGISLYRPGPMDSIPKYIDNKKHPEHIKYVTPELEPILDVTYGCLVYQEQVMQIVRQLGGYSYGRADLVRRAMSKKKHEEMMREKQFFIYGKDDSDGTPAVEGCIQNGISEEAAETIFEDMASFAEYAFNKSHAAAYAVVAYETAYLKCHYPVEYMTALLSSVIGDAAHTSTYIRNCREMGIEVLPPSVSRSEARFTVENGKIRYGLAGVKAVGMGFVHAVTEARAKAPFTSFFDFVRSVDSKELNRKAVENLIRAGAFDEFTENRAALLAVCEEAVKAAQSNARRVTKDQVSLFQLDDDLFDEVKSDPELPKIANFERADLLRMEREMLGIYLSGHLLDEYAAVIRGHISATSLDISHAAEAMREGRTSETALHDGDTVIVAGLVSSLRTMITKKQQEMARLELEDLYGTMHAIVFPSVYQPNKTRLVKDAAIAVRGTLQLSDESDPEILINALTGIESAAELGRDPRRSSYARKDDPYSGKERPKAMRPSPSAAQVPKPADYVKLRISKEFEGDRLEPMKNHILELIGKHHGNRPVLLYLPDGKQLQSANGIAWDEAVRSELEQLLGKENVKA